MNTTKKLISLTLAAAMSLSLAACGGGGTSAGSTPPPSGSSTGSGAVQSVADYDIQPELDSSVDYTQGDSYSFIIATDGAEDRVDGLLVHYMADQLNAITGGRIQLQMYFNGSMGTDTELCESTQAGDVAFFLGSTAFTANFVPELNAIDLPFLYQDAQQPIHQFYAVCCIFRVSVRSDLICKTFIDRRTTNNDLAVASHFFCQFHNVFHAHHRGCHKG